jgi:hypothetical protein
VLARCLFPLVLLACGQDRPDPGPIAPAIEARDGHGVQIARITPGHPCRATVDSLELLVGGRPLVAQQGSIRWTGEDASQGTTLFKNGVAVARIHAGQLFDKDGVPIVGVRSDGSVTDATGKTVRTAKASPPGAGPLVTIGDAVVVGTRDLVLAAMLAAPELPPDVRALVGCHFLLPAEVK